MLITRFLKTLLPDREFDLPIFAGPFRGGVFRSRPRDSIRKMLGLYEHELNTWLAQIPPTVDDVLAGAGEWLRPSTAFLIEVHDRKFIEPQTTRLKDAGISARLINQRPLPFLGRENRSVDNWWLVTAAANTLVTQ